MTCRLNSCGAGLANFFQEHWQTKEITNHDVVLVAQEQSLIGFVAILCRPTPLIDNLHVRHPYRSQHIGTALIQAATKELLKKGHTTASLWAFNSNKKAIRFYERLGGIKKERVKRNVLGFEILSQKIFWPDLTVILKNQTY